jgi:hypothetical protein
MESTSTLSGHYETFVLLAIIWTFGFAASISQTTRDDVFKSCSHTIATGTCGGFFSVGMCSLLSSMSYSMLSYPAYYVGLSALLGLSGKYQEMLLKRTLNFIFSFKEVANNMKKYSDFENYDDKNSGN